MTTQLALLTKPFLPRYISPAPKGKYGSYVSHDVVLQKILAVCGPHSFEVEQVIYSDGQVEGCVARLTVEVDGHEVSIAEVGDCEQPANWKTNGQRLKDAASDAYKRCAMRLGVGLHLWAGDHFFIYDYLRSLEPEAQPPTLPDLGTDLERPFE